MDAEFAVDCCDDFDDEDGVVVVDELDAAALLSVSALLSISATESYYCINHPKYMIYY